MGIVSKKNRDNNRNHDVQTNNNNNTKIRVSNTLFFYKKLPLLWALKIS